MPARHLAPRDRRPGEVLVRLGALVFAVGVVGAVAILVPFLAGTRRDAPTALDLVALLLPLGLALGLLGLFVTARSHGR